MLALTCTIMVRNAKLPLLNRCACNHNDGDADVLVQLYNLSSVDQTRLVLLKTSADPGGGGRLPLFDSIFKTHFLILKLTIGGFCSLRRLPAICSFLDRKTRWVSIKLSNHRALPSCTTHNLKIKNVVPCARRSRRDVSQARPDCRHTVIALPLRPRENCRRDIIAQMSRKG